MPRDLRTILRDHLLSILAQRQEALAQQAEDAQAQQAAAATRIETAPAAQPTAYPVTDPIQRTEALPVAQPVPTRQGPDADPLARTQPSGVPAPPPQTGPSKSALDFQKEEATHVYTVTPGIGNINPQLSQPTLDIPQSIQDKEDAQQRQQQEQRREPEPPPEKPPSERRAEAAKELESNRVQQPELRTPSAPVPPPPEPPKAPPEPPPPPKPPEPKPPEVNRYLQENEQPNAGGKGRLDQAAISRTSEAAEKGGVVEKGISAIEREQTALKEGVPTYTGAQKESLEAHTGGWSDERMAAFAKDQYEADKKIAKDEKDTLDKLEKDSQARDAEPPWVRDSVVQDDLALKIAQMDEGVGRYSLTGVAQDQELRDQVSALSPAAQAAMQPALDAAEKKVQQAKDEEQAWSQLSPEDQKTRAAAGLQGGAYVSGADAVREKREEEQREEERKDQDPAELAKSGVQHLIDAMDTLFKPNPVEEFQPQEPPPADPPPDEQRPPPLPEERGDEEHIEIPDIDTQPDIPELEVTHPLPKPSWVEPVHGLKIRKPPEENLPKHQEQLDKAAREFGKTWKNYLKQCIFRNSRPVTRWWTGQATTLKGAQANRIRVLFDPFDNDPQQIRQQVETFFPIHGKPPVTVEVIWISQPPEKRPEQPPTDNLVLKAYMYGQQEGPPVVVLTKPKPPNDKPEFPPRPKKRRGGKLPDPPQRTAVPAHAPAWDPLPYPSEAGIPEWDQYDDSEPWDGQFGPDPNPPVHKPPIPPSSPPPNIPRGPEPKQWPKPPDPPDDDDGGMRLEYKAYIKKHGQYFQRDMQWFLRDLLKKEMEPLTRFWRAKVQPNGVDVKARTVKVRPEKWPGDDAEPPTMLVGWGTRKWTNAKLKGETVRLRKSSDNRWVVDDLI
jgi:hypothetical protein